MLFARMSKLQALKNAALAFVAGLVFSSCGLSLHSGAGLKFGAMFFGVAAFYGWLFRRKARRDRQLRVTTVALPQESGPAQAQNTATQRSSDFFVPDPLD